VDPVDLAQQLIRMDTTNPPGNEAAAIELVASVLRDTGVDPTIVVSSPGRPNLIARLPGRGEADGLLLQGHVDVVSTSGQPWSRDPFAGDIVDGWLWGRGSIDMKGGVAMMVEAFARLSRSGTAPAGDVVLCVLSDEESGGSEGARFLVEEHPELFAGLRHGIGEFGGFPLMLGGRRFYPIQIAERVGVRFDLTIRGPAGHGSLPLSGGAMAKLGKMLTRLDRRRLPIHIVPATRLMLEAMAEHTDGPTRRILRSLLDPRTAGVALKVLGSRLAVMEPVLRNTVNATIVAGGDTVNVVPGEVRLTLDGRMLPGFDPEEMVAELRHLLGGEVVIAYETEGLPPAAEPDMSLFPVLVDLVKDMDPDGVPIPFLLPAVTDGRWFARLGIQHYGFLPMRLPDDFVFQRTVHAADERIPIEAIGQGAETMFRLLTTFGTK
jgi:acetylornithine deacetylase/succinyl-diaminopimelate desuccinylase-like protein